MNKNFTIILICCVILGLIIYGVSLKQQVAQESARSSREIQALEEEATGWLKQAQQAAEEVVSKAEEVKSEVQEEAKAQVSQDLLAQITELLAKAKAYIDGGEYQQAIDTASFILSNLNADSIEAKGIIDMAKAKIQEIAQSQVAEVQQAAQAQAADVQETAQEAAQDVQEGFAGGAEEAQGALDSMMGQ